MLSNPGQAKWSENRHSTQKITAKFNLIHFMNHSMNDSRKFYHGIFEGFLEDFCTIFHKKILWTRAKESVKKYLEQRFTFFSDYRPLETYETSNRLPKQFVCRETMLSVKHLFLFSLSQTTFFCYVVGCLLRLCYIQYSTAIFSPNFPCEFLNFR